MPRFTEYHDPDIELLQNSTPHPRHIPAAGCGGARIQPGARLLAPASRRADRIQSRSRRSVYIFTRAAGIGNDPAEVWF